MPRCQQCYLPATSTIMSMFSKKEICPHCKEAEKKLPGYKQAEARDIQQYAGRLDALGMAHQADNCREIAAKLENE